MDEVAPAAHGRGMFGGRFARLSTGMKMFAVLSLALLPLGLVALFASLQSTRNADIERRGLISVALEQSARRLGAEIGTDVTALRLAVDAAARGSADGQLCTRTSSLLSARRPERVEFAIVARDGSALCRTPGFQSAAPPRAGDRRLTGFIDPRRSELRLRVQSEDGSVVGIAAYPERLLSVIGRPGGSLPDYDLWLRLGTDMLTLSDSFQQGPLTPAATLSVTVPPIGAMLEMSVRRAPFTAPEILTMLLPILMWLAAASIGWLVVDRMLIGPLKDLRATVACYRPGEVIDAPRRLTIPAQEIAELSATFRTITETVASHEGELAAGLNRQRKLTREVHHRVKNNLQVVASLINLHARGAKSAEASAAYATIQRRVDALAVVHRNHYAEFEENRGVGLRALIGELASNLRGTAPPEASRLTITLDICPCFVTLDTAVPVSFLITEFVELAMTCDPTARIAIRAARTDRGDCAELSVESRALSAGPLLDEKLGERFGRVLEGLARQLRAPLHRDAEAGRFSVTIPLID